MNISSGVYAMYVCLMGWCLAGVSDGSCIHTWYRAPFYNRNYSPPFVLPSALSIDGERCGVGMHNLQFPMLFFIFCATDSLDVWAQLSPAVGSCPDFTFSGIGLQDSVILDQMLCGQ